MLYGKLCSEEIAEQNLTCRRIVSEITNFGVTQRQIWVILYNLALELENLDEARTLVEFIKEMKGSEILLSMMSDESEAEHG